MPIIASLNEILWSFLGYTAIKTNQYRTYQQELQFTVTSNQLELDYSNYVSGHPLHYIASIVQSFKQQKLNLAGQFIDDLYRFNSVKYNNQEVRSYDLRRFGNMNMSESLLLKVYNDYEANLREQRYKAFENALNKTMTQANLLNKKWVTKEVILSLLSHLSQGLAAEIINTLINNFDIIININNQNHKIKSLTVINTPKHNYSEFNSDKNTLSLVYKFGMFCCQETGMPSDNELARHHQMLNSTSDLQVIIASTIDLMQLGTKPFTIHNNEKGFITQKVKITCANEVSIDYKNLQIRDEFYARAIQQTDDLNNQYVNIKLS